ncbi:glutamyl-tRNA(Gln) amidotransferase subunit A, mitochondrial-like [Gordionus sp. m RMFG-2023]|uniref:glutamyl-tRNA(Gln) amidotransferase subunit A, mitochondrial-like n=1 Tax=Gordionus sp. m RMFG-2023 TaxID=3053472 RepID=UPI0031FDEA01
MNYTLLEVLDLLKHKQTNFSEIYKFCLNGTNYANKLNAYITSNNYDFINNTGTSSKKNHDDPLNGFPFSIKDNFCTKDIKTTCASKMLYNLIAIYDATIYKRLCDAGAILMGKTNMDEFSMGNASINSFYGPVKNPWNMKKKNIQLKNNISNSIFDNNITFNQLKTAKFHTNPNNLIENDNQKMLENDDFHISGGSSGGSAVSVVTGSAFYSIGSDTGGSIRNPASYCGVIGFKPTYGTLSRLGLIPLANNLDTPGIFSRSVQDCTLVYNAIAGLDDGDLTTSAKTIKPSMSLFSSNHDNKSEDEILVRIGIPQEFLNHPTLDPEIRSEVLRIADKLADYSSHIGDRYLVPQHLNGLVDKSNEQILTPPKKVKFALTTLPKALPHFDVSLACYTVLSATDICSNMARYDGIRYGLRESTMADTRTIGFNEIVKGRILAGNYFLTGKNAEAFFQQACKVRRLICQDFSKIFVSYSERSSNRDYSYEPNPNCVDIILTPVTLTTAPKYSEYLEYTHEQVMDQDIFTVHANLAGIPAISIPIALSSTGMPIGLQLMSNHFTESLLLYTANLLEDVIGFFPTLKPLPDEFLL